MPLLILGVIIAYLLGSIPSSVWVSKIFYKQDIRDLGSRNAGLTNIFRIFGWKASVPVAIVDLGKGCAAAWLGGRFPQNIMQPSDFAVFTGLACILGHSYTCLAGFKGGKGVLTGLGVYLFLAPVSALFSFIIWMVVVVPTRYVSLASISAALVLPVCVYFEGLFFKIPLSLKLITVLLSAFIIIRHRANISRLLQGSENRFGKKEQA
jgi:glycerol-3-phosphate acyltransferase PlsY